jgi:ferredoxin
MADDALLVRVDQDLCTGDGLCVQLAPAVFEFDVDGLAYVKSSDGALLTDEGARTPVPATCVKDVIESAEGCPGDCIYVERSDGSVVAGPGAS